MSQGESRAALFVRWVDPAEDLATLVNDMKAMTWENETEYGLLEVAEGNVAIVQGNRSGITFAVAGEGDERTLLVTIDGREVQIRRLLWHTHPRATGPSEGDLKALEILRQAESIIYEIGGDLDGTRIRPKRETYPSGGTP